MIDLVSQLDSSFKDLYHRGVVVDNNDPKKVGRVRCLVDGRLEVPKERYDTLPWIMPDQMGMVGAGRPDSGNFAVPEIRSEVRVRFVEDDPYRGYYVGSWETTNHHTSELWNTNYPDVYGWVDRVIQWLRFDKKDRYVEYFRQATKDYFHIDKDGNWTINVPRNILIKVHKDMELEVTGETTFNLKSGHHVKVSNNFNRKVGGVTTLEGDGTYHLISGTAILTDAPVRKDQTGASSNANIVGELASHVATVEADVAALMAKLEGLHNLALAIEQRTEPFNLALYETGIGPATTGAGVPSVNGAMKQASSSVGSLSEKNNLLLNRIEVAKLKPGADTTSLNALSSEIRNTNNTLSSAQAKFEATSELGDDLQALSESTIKYASGEGQTPFQIDSALRDLQNNKQSLLSNFNQMKSGMPDFDFFEFETELNTYTSSLDSLQGATREGLGMVRKASNEITGLHQDIKRFGYDVGRTVSGGISDIYDQIDVDPEVIDPDTFRCATSFIDSILNSVGSGVGRKVASAIGGIGGGLSGAERAIQGVINQITNIEQMQRRIMDAINGLGLPCNGQSASTVTGDLDKLGRNLEVLTGSNTEMREQVGVIREASNAIKQKSNVII